MVYTEIDSRFELLNHVPMDEEDRSVAVIKNEPMLFNCDLEHADRYGGRLTHKVLDQLPLDWRGVPLVIDSRVHMLMQGWYPCIPGWHHDDVPRTRSDGQPNYGAGQCRSQHIFCLVNGDIAPTALAEGRRLFSDPPLGSVVYAAWHKEVEEKIAGGLLKKYSAPSERLILMNDRTWHTGTAAVANGWRFFIRVSRYFDRDGKPIARGNPRTNELRRQVQVYMDNPNAGW